MAGNVVQLVQGREKAMKGRAFGDARQKVLDFPQIQ